MVKRSAYFAADGKVKVKVVEIEWDLGFTHGAKWEYVRRVFSQLGDQYAPVAEVTSAAFVEDTRRLSPIFVPMAGESISVEDWIQKNQPEDKRVFHWVYLMSLTEKHHRLIEKYKCYTDVFLSPDKDVTNSQAFSLALLQLLKQQNQLEKLEDLQWFLDWFDKVEIKFI